jgi:hypothetical protein
MWKLSWPPICIGYLDWMYEIILEGGGKGRAGDVCVDRHPLIYIIMQSLNSIHAICPVSC